MYQPTEMWEVYCAIDVAVMATTVCEPFGRIPLEARAVGAPTIAPAIGGLRESIRHGVDGLLYRFGDSKDLELQMRRILTEQGLYRKLCTGLQPVLDTRARGEALEAVYRAILSDSTAAVTT
jgi:D-inositol-3-phosphate glycosyltransferase